MSVCNRCERSFVYKNSLRRHQLKRRNPCRPAVTSCIQCGNKFTCFDSLKKHKKLYCKAEEKEEEPLDVNIQDFINQLSSSVLVSDNDDNDDDALTNFVDNLIEEENRKIASCYNEKTETTTTTTTTTNNMWSGIVNALNEWTQKLLDTETCYHKTDNF